MKDYNFVEIEKKWQDFWVNNKTFKTVIDSDKPKYYCLDMFPYPSGSGLHVGHPKGYTATDIMSRYKRLKGFEVLHPMGWDAFGLPAEQYALKTNNHPAGFTQKNIDTFRKQIKSLGFSYDWNREVNTTDPDYYRWSQWIFLKLYENGLAELKNVPVNFCPECNAVLANEEVNGGVCERGHKVVQKDMRQWVLKITHYAQRLLDGLDDLDWPESLKEMQRNWIGKTTGLTTTFSNIELGLDVDVFTTSAYALSGVSAVVISAKHPIIEEISNLSQEATNFVEETKNLTDQQRNEKADNRSAVDTKIKLTNPLTGEEVPLLIGDYVIPSYATGAMLCVPGVDENDQKLAQELGLNYSDVLDEDNKIINCSYARGLTPKEGNEKITSILVDAKKGEETTIFKLRDWIFSRQRYWGEPFPILFDEQGNIKCVDEDSLPVELPHLDQFVPGPDGQSPLANNKDWLEVDVDGNKYYRETNTMPQWAGSCWYFIRYIDPHNNKQLVDPELAKKWLPVDLYIGGAEHAVLHLLYARFWFKFLHDIGVVSHDEPFQRLFNQGMILGSDNQKMSKSKGNVVNPDDIVKSHGADTLRIYEMFMGPLDASVAWTEEGLDGSKRFLDRIWRMANQVQFVDEQTDVEFILNKTIDKVEKDIEKLSFNTAISQLMIFTNEVTKVGQMTKEQLLKFITVLSPFAPHLAEEINASILENDSCISLATWPEIDAEQLVSKTVEVIFQINGKVKAKAQIQRGLTKEELLKKAKEELTSHIQDKEIVKEIVVPEKLVNIVVK